jgi:hypothetical protein
VASYIPTAMVRNVKSKTATMNNPTQYLKSRYITNPPELT